MQLLLRCSCCILAQLCLLFGLQSPSELSRRGSSLACLRGALGVVLGRIPLARTFFASGCNTTRKKATAGQSERRRTVGPLSLCTEMVSHCTPVASSRLRRCDKRGPRPPRGGQNQALGLCSKFGPLAARRSPAAPQTACGDHRSPLGPRAYAAAPPHRLESPPPSPPPRSPLPHRCSC